MLPDKEEVPGSSPVPPTCESPAATCLLALGDRLLVCRMAGMEASWKPLWAQGAVAPALLAAPQVICVRLAPRARVGEFRPEKVFQRGIPSAYPSYKPDPVTAWMAVTGSGLIPRKATLELSMLPANHPTRRLPRSRTRVATPLSERASLLPTVRNTRRQMSRPPLLTRADQISIALESRLHVAVRLPAIGSVANTACSRTCASSPL